MEVEKQLHFYMRFASLLLAIMVVVGCIQSPPVDQFVSTVKEVNSLPAAHSVDDINKLRQKIQSEAKKRNQKPIDARIDPVWKGIPGYNGVMVDVEKTLQKTIQQQGSSKIQWVYNEVKPKVDLQDLGPVPIYRGNPLKPSAALMVNVAWGTEHIPAMLQILAKEKVKATFFFDGSWLKKHLREAKMIQKQGHEIGNHAYSHPLMSQISPDRMRQEMGMTENYMKQILKRQSRFFAPPAGDYNQQVVEIAKTFGMMTVLWTVDTVDWKKSTSPNMMIEKVNHQLENGSLLLTHPTDRTVEALPEMIRIGKRKGIKWGTVSEVLSSERLDIIE